MKRTIFALSALVFALSNTACSEDGLDDKSVITGIGYEIETPFDEWLLENFIEPYNIRVMYRYEDMESDMTYNLVPARYERSIEMAQLVSYLCLQAYDEITGSRDFIRANFPKDLFFVGSPAYNNNGSIVLGTAEGGTKITLYNLNTLDPRNVDALNSSYFKTIHHEFGHILNQKIPCGGPAPYLPAILPENEGSGFDNREIVIHESHYRFLRSGFIMRPPQEAKSRL